MTEWLTPTELAIKLHHAKAILNDALSNEPGVKEAKQTVRMFPYQWEILLNYMLAVPNFWVELEREVTDIDNPRPFVTKAWGMEVILDADVFPRTAVIAALEVRL